MAETFLLAVDASEAARKAVRYVGRLLAGRSAADVSVTLFHVVEDLPPDLLPPHEDAATHKALSQALHHWSSQATVRGEKLLGEHRELLLAAGVPAEAVHAKCKVERALPEARRVVAALAVLDEARSGGYGTVVVGRRGAASLPDLYLGGVADKVSRHLTGATVWIVD
jgi:nucleotide-binding universal stress UspA family protein